MNIFLKEHQDLLGLMLQNHVDFMLIGGYAVIHYGYKRTTADMDLWLKPTNENKKKLLKVLKKLDYFEADIILVEELDFTKQVAFSIGEEPSIIDFLTYINMVNWEEADSQKAIVEIDHIKIPIIHFNHLILSKINNNRTKDQLDIEELQKIRNK